MSYTLEESKLNDLFTVKVEYDFETLKSILAQLMKS